MPFLLSLFIKYNIFICCVAYEIYRILHCYDRIDVYTMTAHDRFVGFYTSIVTSSMRVFTTAPEAPKTAGSHERVGHPPGSRVRCTVPPSTNDVAG